MGCHCALSLTLHRSVSAKDIITLKDAFALALDNAG